LLYSFENFSLDTARRELRRGGALIALQPQVFDLLEYAIRNRERVVSKDDLLTAVWNGRIVSESTLGTRINAARSAIGDSGEKQRLLRTAYGKGIRFVGAVREEEETVGEQQVKNITQPIRAYRVRGEATIGVTTIPPAALPLPDKPSIAVLPFTNMSGDPEQEFFADGIAEDVITNLSRYPSLFVIARNSCFTYKGRAVDVKQVGHELGVRYVLEGSLRKAGNRIRVTAQLVEAETGKHVWAERYDRDAGDIFAVQDEITEAVTIAIAPAIAHAERQRAMRKPPESLDAWAAYQRGLWHLEKNTADDTTFAERFFRQAIDIDSNFPGGHTGLAYAQHQASSRHGLPDSESAESARHAVRLDANDAEARVCLGFMLMWQGNLEAAFAESEAALALSPNLANAHGLRGSVLNWSDQWATARIALERSIRLDPRNPNLAYRYNAVTIGYYLSGEYSAAIEAAHRTIRSYPDREQDYRWLAAALGQLGRVDEAKEALEKAIATAPASFYRYVRTRVPWHRPEHYAHMLEGLRKAGVIT
jgi:adenylate cyclase